MTLPDWIQDVAGPGFIIERELPGDGGRMSPWRRLLARRAADRSLALVHVIEHPGWIDARRFITSLMCAAVVADRRVLPVLVAGRYVIPPPGDSVRDVPYYITAYVGETIEDRLRRDGPFDVTATVTVLRGTANALAAGHRHGALHRNISPSNLYLFEDSVRVGGFCVLQAFIDSMGNNEFALPPLCIEYAAREVFMGETPGPSADVFSLGAVAFAMLTGRPPSVTPADSPTDIAIARVTQTPPTIASRRPDLSPSLVAVIDAALSSAPEQRPTADEFAAML